MFDVQFVVGGALPDHGTRMGEGRMIELGGNKVILRTLEREHCRELWEAYEPSEPIPTEPLNPGLSIEGSDRWFEEMQARQGNEIPFEGDQPS